MAERRKIGKTPQEKRIFRDKRNVAYGWNTVKRNEMGMLLEESYGGRRRSGLPEDTESTEENEGKDDAEAQSAQRIAERRVSMRFAKVVFWVAGIWGVLVITPLYFLFDVIGRQDPPAITHPGFYYGFAGLGLAWQIAFLVIARDPVRFRPMMIPSVVEKFTFGIAVVVLMMQGRMHGSDVVFAGTDLTLGVFFVAAYWRTGGR